MADQTVSRKATLSDEGASIVIRANYEIFVLVVSALQVANWVLIVFLHNGQSERIPWLVNWGIAVFLILDAFYRLWRSHDRRRFLLQFHGYLVFIGSLPFPFSAIFRLIWLRLATQRLRRSDYVQMERIVVRKRAQSAMLMILLAAAVVLEVGSILVIKAESSSPDAKIVTANDAVWWVLVTMATVGYGDLYPVTGAGRLVAVFVMIVGVGIFTVMTSFFAHSFLSRHLTQDEDQILGDDDNPEPVDARGSLEAVKALIDQQDLDHAAAMAELRKRLETLEDQLMRDRAGG